jgi:hypothetical protein
VVPGILADMERERARLREWIATWIERGRPAGAAERIKVAQSNFAAAVAGVIQRQGRPMSGRASITMDDPLADLDDVELRQKRADSLVTSLGRLVDAR